MNSISTFTRSMSKKLNQLNCSGSSNLLAFPAACNKNQNCHISKTRWSSPAAYAPSLAPTHSLPTHLGPIFGASQTPLKTPKGNLVHAATSLDKMGKKGYLCTTFKNRHFGKQRYGEHHNGSENGYALGLLTLSRPIRWQLLSPNFPAPFNQNGTEALISFGMHCTCGASLVKFSFV